MTYKGGGVKMEGQNNEPNVEINKSKKYKIGKYKELGLTIISTNEADMNDPEAALNRKLNNFEFGIINFDNDK